jgi:drug/metabolite transporter (DMT)-like permease
MPSETKSATSPRSAVVRQWQADALLLLIALIWGSTFVLVKESVARFPVFAFLCIRFSLAGLVLAILFGSRLRRMSGPMAGAGALIGLALFGGYAFQTVGLQYTTASKAGFITGLSVVIVPLLSTWLLRQVPTREALLGAALSTLGLALLTLWRDLAPARGDFIVLGCAFCFALHITLVSAFAPRTDALALTIVQVLTVALLSGAAALGFEGWPGTIPVEIWLATAFTGVLATALAFAGQNQMQTRTTATHTALIFAMEPVFAAVFGYWFASERLARSGLAGCGLILLGILLAELPPLAIPPRLRTRSEKE